MHLRRHTDLMLARFFAALLLLTLVGLIVHRADAAEATLTWTLPAQNTDGSAIPTTGAGAITSSRVEWGSCAGSAFGTKAGEATVPAPGATYTVAGLAPATWCFRAFASNSYGVESGPSGVVSKVVVPPTPKPPVLVTVNVVAYEVLPHPIEGTRLGRNVGTVRLGTACGPEPVVQTFGGTYYEVPREAVALTKTPKSAVVVAQCEVS